MFKLPLTGTMLAAASRASARLLTPNSGLHATAATRLKEIQANKVGNKLIIEGAYVPSPRKDYLIENKSECCPLCSLDLNLKHTDVLILSQFLRPDGCMMPRRVTGLCVTQQKIVSKLVSMAHKAGLMSNMTPENSKKDPTRRKDWKKLNTYFDETTIKVYESHFSKIRKDIILKYMQPKN